jgi:hypothetical protein
MNIDELLERNDSVANFSHAVYCCQASVSSNIFILRQGKHPAEKTCF